MKQSWTEGAAVKIHVDDYRHAYGVLLTFPAVEIKVFSLSLRMALSRPN
jgi:hypothetical protein